MADFDYLIDSLNDEAFEFCVDALYDKLGFTNLPKEDVRRVDIKEKFNSKSWWMIYPKGNDYTVTINNKLNKSIISLNSISDYSVILFLFINSNIMDFKTDIRINKYRQKAISSLKKILATKNNCCLKDIEDPSIVFLFLLRKLYAEKYDTTELFSLNDKLLIERFFIQDSFFPKPGISYSYLGVKKT